MQHLAIFGAHLHFGADNGCLFVLDDQFEFVNVNDQFGLVSLSLFREVVSIPRVINANWELTATSF
jgi:hypothetical protein